MTFKLLKRKPNFFLILVNKDGKEELITNSISLLSKYLTEDSKDESKRKETQQLVEILKIHLISEVKNDTKSFNYRSN